MRGFVTVPQNSFLKEPSMTSATPYKVQVRLGQAEFSAEGPEATVREQLASFLQIASIHPASSQDQVGQANGNGHTNGNGKHVEAPMIPAPSSGQEKWVDTRNNGRLFSEDQRNGLISVRVLPKTEEREADTLLLILFGFLTIKNQIEVKASVLLKSAQQSGVNSVSRIDTILDKYASLVRRGGIKRGSWYALTNPGIAHGEKLAKEIFA